jgi:hypothetical protein
VRLMGFLPVWLLLAQAGEERRLWEMARARGNLIPDLPKLERKEDSGKCNLIECVGCVVQVLGPFILLNHIILSKLEFVSLDQEKKIKLQ